MIDLVSLICVVFVVNYRLYWGLLLNCLCWLIGGFECLERVINEEEEKGE